RRRAVGPDRRRSGTGNPNEVTTMSRSARLRTSVALVAISALAVAGCSSSAASPAPTTASSQAAVLPSIAPSVADTPPPSTAPAPPPPPPEPSPSAESSPVAEASGGPTAVPTSIDPCQLITKEEAGQLAGTTFGAGEESETSGHAKLCVYGGQTKNVFTVTVAI